MQTLLHNLWRVFGFGRDKRWSASEAVGSGSAQSRSIFDKEDICSFDWYEFAVSLCWRVRWPCLPCRREREKVITKMMAMTMKAGSMANTNLDPTIAR